MGRRGEEPGVEAIADDVAAGNAGGLGGIRIRIVNNVEVSLGEGMCDHPDPDQGNTDPGSSARAIYIYIHWRARYCRFTVPLPSGPRKKPAPFDWSWKSTPAKSVAFVWPGYTKEPLKTPVEMVIVIFIFPGGFVRLIWFVEVSVAGAEKMDPLVSLIANVPEV